jgi:hypothetical protein
MTALRDAAGHRAGRPRIRVPGARRTGRRLRRHGLIAALARHWLLIALLVAGTALRLVTLVAYRPALIYWDTTRYLENVADLVPHSVRPLGYPAFLAALPIERSLAVVPALQHAMGVAMALVLYALLVRLSVARPLAALAVAPVLLDAYQLNIEQYVLSETLFQLLVVAAAAFVLWGQRPSAPRLAAAGLALAAAALTRGSGVLLIAPVLVAVLALRPRPAALAALALCFAAPLAGYAAWFHSLHGTYSLTSYGGRFLYARVAPFADCARFAVPVAERKLCPQQPLGQRPTVEDFMWSRDVSPVYRLHADRQTRAGSFAKRVIRHQPLDYARVVGRDFLRGFAPARTQRAGELPISRWQFQRHFPIYRAETTAVIRAHGGTRGEVDHDLAGFLRGYQSFAYAPGPLLGAGLVAALLAALGVGRARRSGLRTAAFLFAALGVTVLLTAVGVNQFTWRYWLPELVLLPPAGALGVTALARQRPARGHVGGRAAGARLQAAALSSR